jgi:hypothetical protein
MMWELNSIAEFSRCHCVGVCAVLIPLNLLLNSATILLAGMGRSKGSIYTVASIGFLPAIALILHVVSWWTIGVVMLPTYILPLLAIVCLSIDIYAIRSVDRDDNYFKLLWRWAIGLWRSKTNGQELGAG